MGFKKKKTDKITKTELLLGCSFNDCKQYLEQQFKPEMNWGNHGIIWEIDHIKPCDSFDLTDIEQQKQCFHYSNLQPLFKTTEIANVLGYNEVGNRNKLNKPVDMFNHALDAVRYVALNKLREGNVGKYNISIVGRDGESSRLSIGQSQIRSYIK
jgi:hypothetical protein